MCMYIESKPTFVWCSLRTAHNSSVRPVFICFEKCAAVQEANWNNSIAKPSQLCDVYVCTRIKNVIHDSSCCRGTQILAQFKLLNKTKFPKRDRRTVCVCVCVCACVFTHLNMYSVHYTTFVVNFSSMACVCAIGIPVHTLELLIIFSLHFRFLHYNPTETERKTDIARKDVFNFPFDRFPFGRFPQHIWNMEKKGTIFNRRHIFTVIFSYCGWNSRHRHCFRVVVFAVDTIAAAAATVTRFHHVVP